MNHPDRADAAPVADWEAFYRDYRKPGYVAGYEITSKLGGGMFGLVFKAQKQSIGKDYAIKFLKVDDGEVRRAVLLELEQVKYFAQVDHPNLVAIEDRGEVDGIPYLVMSYAGSQTLRDLLPGEPGHRDELVNYFLQACRGVSALHQRSLVHFDLKPANVFLKGGVARVGDYGLSKLVAHSGGSLSMGRGTPYYMAPEVMQRRGDQRSDVYSLGVMLYEILVGEVPFRGDSEWEVLKKHEQQQPEFPPQLPRRERAVLERCLHKDPAQRFQRVEELLAAMGAEHSAATAVYPAARAAVAPPIPPPLPGPPKAAEDPYLAFGRAAREAASNAGKIARSAMAHAQQAVKRAHADAGRAVREALQSTRARRREQRQQRRAARTAAKAMAREQRRAARASRPRRGVLPLAAAALLLMLFAMASVFALWNGVSSRGPVRLSAQVDLPRPPTPPIPGKYLAVVSTQEPEWVAIAAEDLARGSSALAAHLAEFASWAPLRESTLISAQDLPDLGPGSSDLEASEQQELSRLLARLMAGQDYDQGTATALRALEREALYAASRQLESLPADSPAGLAAARNLQRFLEETTGYHEIRLIDAPGMTPASRARANAIVGRLWRWFLNEAAPNDRAWKLYQELRR